jgi:hypothetical protein
MRATILLVAGPVLLGSTSVWSADTAAKAGVQTNAPRPEGAAPPAAAAGQNRPARAPRQIVLGPDDKPAFPAAPAGFDQKREGIIRGKLELVEYHSTTVGTNRHALIYTPPGFFPSA